MYWMFTGLGSSDRATRETLLSDIPHETQGSIKRQCITGEEIMAILSVTEAINIDIIPK